MTVEEAKSSFEKFKKQGLSEEEILGVLYLMYQDDKIDEGALSDLVRILGYELSEDFLNMSEEEKKTKGYTETDDKKTNVDDEVVEESKYIKKGHSEEESEADKNKNSDNEDKKARKLFGLDEK